MKASMNYGGPLYHTNVVSSRSDAAAFGKSDARDGRRI
jgi:hypothetical protein